MIKKRFDVNGNQYQPMIIEIIVNILMLDFDYFYIFFPNPKKGN